VARRIAFILVVAAVLLALILYSQFRPQAGFVSGAVEADEIRVGSRVGGRVSRVLVSEGDTVDAGQPLVEFEPYDLLEREQQAIAELAAREASLQKLKAGLREEEIGQAKARYDEMSEQLKLLEEGPRKEEILAAESRVSAAKSMLLLAKQEYDRVAGLFQTKAIAKAEMDRASETLAATTADLDVRNNELSILKAGARLQELEQGKAKVEEARLAWELAKKGSRVEDVEQAAAARDAADAALKIIRKQKSELIINAPDVGYIDALDLQAGDLVGANAPVLTMLPRRRLWVRAYVPQRFLQLKLGQKLRVSIDSFPNEEFIGEVTFISHQAEFTPANVQTSDERAKQVYRIRVTIGEGAEKLRAGMTANVWLDPLDGKL